MEIALPDLSYSRIILLFRISLFQDLDKIKRYCLWTWHFYTVIHIIIFLNIVKNYADIQIFANNDLEKRFKSSTLNKSFL